MFGYTLDWHWRYNMVYKVNQRIQWERDIRFKSFVVLDRMLNFERKMMNTEGYLKLYWCRWRHHYPIGERQDRDMIGCENRWLAAASLVYRRSERETFCSPSVLMWKFYLHESRRGQWVVTRRRTVEEGQLMCLCRVCWSSIWAVFWRSSPQTVRKSVKFARVSCSVGERGVRCARKLGTCV